MLPDDRGSFHEWCGGEEFREATGYGLAPAQAEAERLGLLPSYEACRARYEELRGRGLSG
ncbi:hypothetical protein ACFP51_12200 [Streptomyces pratens]|uniref:Uncharacterized protein n=1 Tax=Streptomyces pratens TaxID=887456 RepID=A0ABW1LUX3_9ACTN